MEKLSNIKPEEAYFYNKLSKKTQMFSCFSDTKFLNRLSHTKIVVDVCKDIYSNLPHKNVNLDRLLMSAKLHDIGHTPFGHAGEETINDLFIKIDNSHYSATYPGLFKHNLNSIRILSEKYEFQENDYVLLDSILKHTSTCPKNYNFDIFSESNILKFNYIFVKNNFVKSDFLQKFYEIYENKKCKKRTEIPVNGRKFCYSCKNKEICYFSKDNKISDLEKLSCYLSYPYPLTTEGSILLWSDEISCLIGDLKDLFYYLIKFEEDVDTFVPFSSLRLCYLRLSACFKNNILVSYFCDYFELIKNNFNIESKLENCSKILQKIKTELISKLTLISKKKFIDVVFKRGGCSPRIILDKETHIIFKEIKDSIYKDIHSISIIKQNNQDGSKKIRSLIEYYIAHINYFITDYEKIYKNSELIKKLSIAISNVLNIRKSTEFGTTHYLMKQLKKKSFSIESEYLCNLEFIKDKIKSKQKNNAVKNLFKREIGYFVASLDEEQINNLYKNYISS
mgnify:CR=1 FL=1